MKNQGRIVKIGIFGLCRGGAFYNQIMVNNGEIVAVCDMDEKKLARAKELLGNDVATYTDFDEFINHEGLEAVFLGNFFHEHAPYAIKALEKNIHVISECTSNGTMAEGVALVRAAEKSKAIYMISENYPYMVFNQEMHKVCRSGKLGKVLYAEGEYNHPFDTYGDMKGFKGLHPYGTHWRQLLPKTYYITHSLAPLMYITGATPKRVMALPCHVAEPADSPYADTLIPDRTAVLMTLNDDESVFRVTGCAAFGGHENSYRVCGMRGQIENIRGTKEINLLYNSWQVPEGEERKQRYTPEFDEEDREIIEKAGHGGGDYYVIKEFFRCIREGRKHMFDEYFATTMASVAILGHRSLLEKGVPYDIPDFRLEEDRKKYENDYSTPFYGSDGSKPTIRNCSDPDYVYGDEQVARYDEIMKDVEYKPYFEA